MGCVMDVLDEIKDDGKYNEMCEGLSDDDLHPDNVVPFPTKSNRTQREILITSDEDGKPIDRRVQVFFNKKEFHTRRYFMLSQITMTLASGKTAAGSASLFFWEENPYFLTCAHNLMQLGNMNEVMKVYHSRYGSTRLASGKVYMRNMAPHPKFDGHTGNGYDIGIFRPVGGKHRKDTENTYGDMKTIEEDVILHYATANLKKGMTIEIAGYPKDKKGYPYTHVGTIEKIDGSLIWYNADTTEGNSGSSIVVTDQDYVRSITKKPEIKKIIIGVHSASDISGPNPLNYGTLITEKIYGWIKRTESKLVET